MRLKCLLILTGLFTLALMGVAFAQDGSIGPTQPGVTDMGWVLVSGSLVPLLVAIVTKWNSSSVLKAVVMAVVNILASSVLVWKTWPDGTQFSEFAFAALTAIIASAGTYYGFWKPTLIAPKIAVATTPGQGGPPQ